MTLFFVIIVMLQVFFVKDLKLSIFVFIPAKLEDKNIHSFVKKGIAFFQKF